MQWIDSNKYVCEIERDPDQAAIAPCSLNHRIVNAQNTSRSSQLGIRTGVGAEDALGTLSDRSTEAFAQRLTHRGSCSSPNPASEQTQQRFQIQIIPGLSGHIGIFIPPLARILADEVLERALVGVIPSNHY